MSLRYSMEIKWSEEDQVFIVRLPEFPDCQTHGESYEQAVKSGREVLDILIQTYQAEGRTLPDPKPVPEPSHAA